MEIEIQRLHRVLQLAEGNAYESLTAAGVAAEDLALRMHKTLELYLVWRRLHPCL